MSENSNKKGNTVLLTVIAVATLLVAVVGATFAYFTASVSGNETASSIIVNTATIGTVTFADGEEINLKNALPGTEATKTFKITTTTTNAAGVGYAIKLVVATNDFEKTTNDLIYSLKGTNQTGSGGSLVADVDSGTLNDFTGTKTLGTGLIKQNETHSYTFTIRFREMGSDQNSNQGKTFSAALKVDTSDSGDLYYNSANPSGTTEMPSSDNKISAEE